MFKSNIKEIMKEKGIKIRDISLIDGLSSATLAKARSDEGISECRLSTLGRIANALGVSVKDTFDGEHDGQGKEGEGENPTGQK